MITRSDAKTLKYGQKFSNQTISGYIRSLGKQSFSFCPTGFDYSQALRPENFRPVHQLSCTDVDHGNIYAGHMPCIDLLN